MIEKRTTSPIHQVFRSARNSFGSSSLVAPWRLWLWHQVIQTSAVGPQTRILLLLRKEMNINELKWCDVSRMFHRLHPFLLQSHLASSARPKTMIYISFRMTWVCLKTRNQPQACLDGLPSFSKRRTPFSHVRHISCEDGKSDKMEGNADGRSSAISRRSDIDSFPRMSLPILLPPCPSIFWKTMEKPCASEMSCLCLSSF